MSTWLASRVDTMHGIGVHVGFPLLHIWKYYTMPQQVKKLDIPWWNRLLFKLGLSNANRLSSVPKSYMPLLSNRFHMHTVTSLKPQYSSPAHEV